METREREACLSLSSFSLPDVSTLDPFQPWAKLFSLGDDLLQRVLKSASERDQVDHRKITITDEI